MTQAFLEVSDRITMLSGGRLVMKGFPENGVVPADQELVEGVDKGVLDYCLNGPMLWRAKNPQAGLFSIVVAGPSAMEMMYWYLVGGGLELGQKMFDANKMNAKMMYGFPTTPEVFLYSKVPITKKEDVKGLKIRVIGDEATIFAKLGVVPTNVTSPEIYEAVKRGVIDGFQHSSLSSDLTMAFQEVVKYAYVSEIRQPCDPQIFAVNKKSWADLPDDLKALVEDEFKLQGLKYYSKQMRDDTVAVDKWKGYGVNVLPCPQDLADELSKVATAFYQEKAAADPLYKEIYESLLTFKSTVRATFSRL